MKSKKTVLISSMLDFHFPLLQYAFSSNKYDAVILDNSEGITDTGLEYSHNDLCYPCVLIIGQMINALKSGKYNLKNTILMIPQAGDACRGSNYIHMIRKALKKAGFENVPIVSLNVKGLEEDSKYSITIGMVRRAVAAVMYSDILMFLKNQIEPYEKVNGETKSCVDKWIKYLGDMIRINKKLGAISINKTMKKIARDFEKISCVKRAVKKVGFVGELYVKYCHLGNWNLEKLLKEQSCEYMVNGFSWYVLYYIDAHMSDENAFFRFLYTLGLKYLGGLQKSMVKSIRASGFYCIDAFKDFKHNAQGKVSFVYRAADGWLIGCETVNLIKCGFKKVLCVQPFGCMPNHVCGKGIYPHLQRQFLDAHIVSVDYDSSGSDVNVRNRIQMLIDL